MATDKVGGVAVSIAYTAVGTGGTGPINKINSWSFSKARELAEFLDGPARVNSHYQGTDSATITIETSDIGNWAEFEIGQKYSNVILTLGAAVDSAGTAVGNNVTVTLSKAVVSEIGELSGSNENKAPVVASVTFQLSRHPGDTEDPTYTIASAA